MTTPGITAPDGSFVLGSEYGQDITEASAKSLMSGGVKTSFGGAQTALNNEIKAPMVGQAGSITNHETRIVALEDGGTMTVYSGNDTWVNIGGRVGIGVINGGQAGQNGQGSSGQRLGGTHGGYQYQEFDALDLTATVAITVGAPGATQAQGGGISSFGSYLVGISGTLGAVLTSKGAVASASAPGAGGNNGGSAQGSAGLPGGASALAAGGAGGVGGGGTPSPGQPGAAGGSVSTASLIPCGGGGGGAGGGNAGLGSTSGHGGAGGAPGGGGGAGGNYIDLGTVGAFGPGGAGRVFVIQSAGA